jgi:hypothetical protein
VQAFILIQTEVGRASAIAAQIAQITGVQSAQDVIGPYDVIARVSADDIAPVTQEIRRVPGITRTLTCDIPEKPKTI